jgi:hypothetical protein
MTDLAKLPAVDPDVPNAARMYDYHLGGSHNFAADRAAADKARAAMPWIREAVRANRAFLGRAVRFCQAQGIDQFLDLGSGIPTAGNVHEIAVALNPAARTVYVDTDPVAVVHSRSILADEPRAIALEGDLREPAEILRAPGATEFLDFTRPIAVLMFAVLHFVPDEDDPAAIIDAYRRATVPGSYFALSHATGDYWPERARQTEDIYEKSRNAMTFRSRDQIAGLLTGYELVPPGLVDFTSWRPDTDPEAAAADPLGGDVKRYSGYAAVGRRA